jgi:hypothetical protein
MDITQTPQVQKENNDPVKKCIAYIKFGNVISDFVFGKCDDIRKNEKYYMNDYIIEKLYPPSKYHKYFIGVLDRNKTTLQKMYATDSNIKSILNFIDEKYKNQLYYEEGSFEKFISKCPIIPPLPHKYLYGVKSPSTPKKFLPIIIEDMSNISKL